MAIKKLTSGGPQGDREFQVEIDMLSRLHHRNLVKLVGYSSRDSSQHLLCYELVPNGSLEAWLHGNILLTSFAAYLRSDITIIHQKKLSHTVT